MSEPRACWSGDECRDTRVRLDECRTMLDERDATIARLTAEIATFQAMMLDCEAERDALAADLAALREDNAFLTGQWHAAADGLAALRARVEAAVARCQRTISAWNTNHGAVSYFRCEEASDLLAILSPPRGPTEETT